MLPRAVRPRRKIDYMGIEFAEGIDGENQRSRHHKLLKRDVLVTRYPDDATLRALGLFDSFRWMLNNLGMSYFFSLTSPTYIRLTYEFLRSFRYTTPIRGPRTTDTAHFRMFNRNYSINQDQMADLLSSSSGYHPREEYDYTAMRTTLDDILSEIRHLNDVDTDSDMLLRNIQSQ
ncbi:hypothetical protein KIW84_063910 [Lathyrus oleraceus]|uniref:Arabidopsis retrotransposon Orf1 C-terminal domain-containing protein n=1 Tax=Pisum sativum TaxID=3888 RepID=A0A9D5A7E4_PEA|nr:hypothetical protein KIW84_063910 [Pisum sativum]